LISSASSVVVNTLRRIATERRKHQRRPRSRLHKPKRRDAKRESRRLKNLLRLLPLKAMLLKLNLLVMQVLSSLPLVALSGLSLELVLIGTLTQVQLHI